ncbi:hypothetical protein QBC42DRAFT_262858 [Cladorrhinum samala]|uniref:Uncharacterized protein n=1 Tax=Cladorrhinum samala TaxID=585594 RepID=A0AAV9HZ36_9PEZI|nr:hypothetical protein QBC42DRAFT_262858 [Cladorrhinum samala]
MTDRHPSSSRAMAPNISRARGGGAGGRERERLEREMPTASSAASSVRRNLFQSQLTRRPTAGSATSDETVRLDSYSQHSQHSQQHHPQRLSPDLPSPSAADIVVRDKNGEIELGDPPTPPIDDPDELEALSEQHETERERQRLADAVKQHQIDQNSIPMHREELLEAVRASLKSKVAALAEDNWMYEREEMPRHQL